VDHSSAYNFDAAETLADEKVGYIQVVEATILIVVVSEGKLRAREESSMT
jgi:hypothetical protein